MNASATSPPLERMQCMEVWGGNLAVDKSLTTPGLRVRLSSEPYEDAEQGGDVYYVSSCASGRITRLLLADVSGHGIGVSRLAVTLRDLMRGNVNVIDQTSFVSAMNQQFIEAANDGGFATAVVLTFFAPTSTLQLCNAGHPAPLLYSAAEQTWSKLSQPEPKAGAGVVDLPLGVLGESDYTRLEYRMAPGDAILCYSDAFSEATEEDGNMIGMDGLLQLVQSIPLANPSAFLAELRRRISGLQSDNLDRDDSTAVLIQSDGSGATMRDSLMAPLRLFGKARDNTALR